MKIVAKNNKNQMMILIIKKFYFDEIIKYCPLTQEIGDNLWYNTIEKLKKYEPNVIGFFSPEYQNKNYVIINCRNKNFSYNYGLNLK